MAEGWDWDEVAARIERAKEAIVGLRELTDPTGVASVAQNAINGALVTLGVGVMTCYKLKVRLPGITAMPGLNGGVWLTWGDGTPPRDWLVMHRIPPAGNQILQTWRVGGQAPVSDELDYWVAMDEFEGLLKRFRDEAGSG